MNTNLDWNIAEMATDNKIVSLARAGYTMHEIEAQTGVYKAEIIRVLESDLNYQLSNGHK